MYEKMFQNSGKINKEISKYWYQYQSLLLLEREFPHDVIGMSL